jgi:hypothetical protein
MGFFFLYLWGRSLFTVELVSSSSFQLEPDPHESDPATAARDQYATLLPVKERVPGVEHPDTLATRANLAARTQQAEGSHQCRDGKPK